jgi:hypothetical protein
VHSRKQACACTHKHARALGGGGDREEIEEREQKRENRREGIEERDSDSKRTTRLKRERVRESGIMRDMYLRTRHPPHEAILVSLEFCRRDKRYCRQSCRKKLQQSAICSMLSLHVRAFARVGNEHIQVRAGATAISTITGREQGSEKASGTPIGPCTSYTLTPKLLFAATMRWHGILGAKGLRRISCERKVT